MVEVVVCGGRAALAAKAAGSGFPPDSSPQSGRAPMDAGDVVNVGTPPGPLSDWAIKKVHFHGFAGLPTTRNVPAESPEFSCFGHQWMVAIYPGGHKQSKEEGNVTVLLYNQSLESIQAHFKFVLKHPTDRTKRTFQAKWDDKMITFGGDGQEGYINGWGKLIFAKRETVLTYLDNGSLKLEVHLRTNKQTEPTSFVPCNSFCKNMLEGFNNEDMSDVRFEVGGEVESAANRRKRAKNTATTFYASHLILRLNAPSLADMCRPGDEAAVPIDGVNPEVFTRPFWDCQLQAEAVLTEQTEITVDNMLDNLLYANSKNLALFQEKIMDFVAENGDRIVGNVSFDDVPGNLISDILTAVARGKRSISKSAPEDDLKFMRVGELRKRLHDKGLCIDGSRETMIALLRENLTSDETGAEETS
ncbi:hypothetical protein THAOC_25556 [Thalassiosira oceanica]|uniref:MATH domain-containing protein n=1 Tax=Thalassiosira oceanica TaxID=159749 RepID=K0RM51_THAOC|nr:hypothetical protein THAOC_25556 [Thalassiosira oceanica]|eukprot:EJK54788.1 hypothetical protein THAOC_25556 [Thalassiosira oceanica]